MPLVVTAPSSSLVPYARQTLASIRQQIGLLMGELTYGPVLSATSTTFVLDAIARYPDNAQRLVGGIAYVVSGVGVGQSRVVTATVQATKTATVQTAWTTTPDSSSVIEVWVADRDPVDVNNAINLAILDAQELVFVPDRLNPTAISSTYREITIPPSFLYVYGFRMKNTDGKWVEYHLQYSVDDLGQAGGDRNFYLNGSTLVIWPTLSASNLLTDMWVLGYRRPVQLVNDYDVSDVRSDYLVFYAATLLEASKAGGSTIDPEDHGSRAANWLRSAMEIRMRLETALEPNTQEVYP